MKDMLIQAIVSLLEQQEENHYSVHELYQMWMNQLNKTYDMLDNWVNY